jgi:hypothetical protein
MVEAGGSFPSCDRGASKAALRRAWTVTPAVGRLGGEMRGCRRLRRVVGAQIGRSLRAVEVERARGRSGRGQSRVGGVSTVGRAAVAASSDSCREDHRNTEKDYAGPVHLVTSIVKGSDRAESPEHRVDRWYRLTYWGDPACIQAWVEYNSRVLCLLALHLQRPRLRAKHRAEIKQEV